MDTVVPLAHLPQGTCLNDTFEIDRHIASGGMGEIYRGHNVQTGDPVAIKVMRRDLPDNDVAHQLFVKEASALNRLHHEAIVRYYLFSKDRGTGRHYLAMEFVDGLPLSDLLTRGPLGFNAVRLLQARLAAGLDAAHRHGIIHRDLAPDNVLIPANDLAKAKIIDFGIARSIDSGDPTIIGSGFAGKYNYVSPEQLGLFGGTITVRSDIYSLGLLLAACLLGRPLDMGGSQLEMLEKRRTLPDLTAVDRRLLPLLQKMLQPDPAKRPESMAAVAAWQPEAWRPEARQPETRQAGAAGPAPRRRRAALAAVLLGGALLAGGGAKFYFAAANVPAAPTPPDPDAPAAVVAETVRAREESPLPAAPDDAAPPPSAAPPASDAWPDGPPATAGRPSPGERPEADPRQRIADFVNAYNGGDCFFLAAQALAPGAVALDGLGSSVAPFEVFDYEFKRSHGFEASIGVHQVMPEQCPAVNFLYQTRSHRNLAPQLDVAAAGLKEGVVRGATTADGNVELLLAGDDGYVRNLTGMLKGAGAARTFALSLTRTVSGPSRPQLLIAIASAKPLKALRLPTDGSLAKEVFSQVLLEASRSGQPLGVTAKYFMLEK